MNGFSGCRDRTKFATRVEATPSKLPWSSVCDYPPRICTALCTMPYVSRLLQLVVPTSRNAVRSTTKTYNLVLQPGPARYIAQPLTSECPHPSTLQAPFMLPFEVLLLEPTKGNGSTDGHLAAAGAGH